MVFGNIEILWLSGLTLQNRLVQARKLNLNLADRTNSQYLMLAYPPQHTKSSG